LEKKSSHTALCVVSANSLRSRCISEHTQTYLHVLAKQVFTINLIVLWLPGTLQVVFF